MKLLFCPKCHDIRAFSRAEVECVCGASSARYVDDLVAEVQGDGILIGVANQTLNSALYTRSLYPSENLTIAAWLISKPNRNVIYR